MRWCAMGVRVAPRCAVERRSHSLESAHIWRMGFVRERKIGNRTYLYYEERWRENGKVKSRSRIVRRARGSGSGPSSPGVLVPALPFMIAYDLISGSRVKALKEARARGSKPSEPARAWARQKFDNYARQRAFEAIVSKPALPSHPGFKSNTEVLAAMEAKEVSKSEAAQTSAAGNDAHGDDEGTDAQ